MNHGFDTSKAPANVPLRLTLTLALAVVSMVWVTLLEDQIIHIYTYIYINTWSTQTLRILRVNTRTGGISEKNRKPQFSIEDLGY